MTANEKFFLYKFFGGAEMNAVKRFAAFIAANKGKIALIATGHGGLSIISWIYDNPLYITVIALLGPFVGGMLMTVGSLVICLGLVLFYNRKGVDWLGVGAIDSIRKLSLRYAEKLAEWRVDSMVGKMLLVFFYLPIRLILFFARLVNHKFWGDIVAFVLLSIFEDPFITTAYLRHGYYGPMKTKDWVVFFGSVLLSNGYWVLRAMFVIEIAKAVWKFS